MKAAILEALASPLVLRDVPDPILRAGEVIVDIAATSVLGYAREVFSGERRYLLQLPAVPGPGGVGRVRAVGPDATRLAVGDWVYCDATVRSRDGGLTPEIILQGLTAGGEAGLGLQRHFRDGSFAQQMRTPTENAVPLGPIDPEDAPLWCGLGALLVPYGGLLAMNLQAGETVVVSGATGKFGSAAVAVAIAMGAARVVATGRNQAALARLESILGSRVRPVVMLGDEAGDRAKILDAAAGPVDCVLDILPPAASAVQARTALMTVRPNGRVALMGGVGTLGGDDLALPYPWLMRNNISLQGRWMYPSSAIPRMIAMVQSGLIDLRLFETVSFSLDQANEAVEHAAVNAGPFRMTVIRPQTVLAVAPRRSRQR